MKPTRTEKVRALRESLKAKCDGIGEEPGVYRWWVREEAAKKLLEPLPGVDFSKLQRRIVDGCLHLALYFGIARHLRQRLNWHINQKHSPSTVESGFLSTLRQTIGALHGLPASMAESAVNDFMDSDCCLEFRHTSSREEAEEIERREISQNYYPLNVQGNKGVEKETVRALSHLRKKFKI